MRIGPITTLSFLLLAGCAGYVVDHVRGRGDVMAPELGRYGFDERQAQCVAGRLAADLTTQQAGLFARRAAALQEGWYVPGQLTPRDLGHVAAHFDPAVALALSRANEACGVTGGLVPQRIAAAPAASAAPESSAPAAAPAPASLPSAAASGAWLNLGAAPTGQSIAVDASSLIQNEGTRRAWFRLSAPGTAAPSGISYLLRIDCAARTISPLAHRRAGPDGEALEHQEYGPDESQPMPIEGGTVMEIAWLALCTG